MSFWYAASVALALPRASRLGCLSLLNSHAFNNGNAYTGGASHARQKFKHEQHVIHSDPTCLGDVPRVVFDLAETAKVRIRQCLWCCFETSRLLCPAEVNGLYSIICPIQRAVDPV